MSLVGLLAFCFFQQRSPTTKGIEVGARQQHQSDQPSVSKIHPPTVADSEVELRNRARSVLAKAMETRRALREKITPEEKKTRDHIREERYRHFFQSQSIAQSEVTAALQILIERDRQLETIDDAMLDGKISLVVATKEKNALKRGTEAKLSEFLGPEITINFLTQDNISNRRAK
jgi:hypothetical protein